MPELSTIADLHEDEENPREITAEAFAGLKVSVHEFGDLSGIVFNLRTQNLVCGHQRIGSIRASYGDLPIKFEIIESVKRAWIETPGGIFNIRLVDWDLKKQRAANIAANNPHISGTFSEDLQPQLRGLLEDDSGLFNALRLDDLVIDEAGAGDAGTGISLSDRFLIPPFSIFDSRAGYWQDRKRAWKSLGIKSEIGRGENLLAYSDTVLQPDPKKRAESRKRPNPHLTESAQKALGFYKSEGGTLPRYGLKTQTEGGLTFGEGPPTSSAESLTGTSIFDPVLAEIIYSWFCMAGGKIIDPFAGGSVRGIVAGYLGYKYSGIDLRSEQIEANKQQLKDIACKEEPQWFLGDSQDISTILPDLMADLIFSCPPYFDLEIYSEDKNDLSNMSWEKFSEIYCRIIAESVAKLKPDRFACFVVGDVRDKNGFYRNFVDLTKAAFEKSGALFYNEIVLVNAVGTASVRAPRQFQAGRKVVKMHQNVMVFFKGNPKKIKEIFGDVAVAEFPEEPEA